MTLRGSEQSLLHDLIHEENKGSGPNHTAPFFSLMLFLAFSCLTLTIWSTLEVLTNANLNDQADNKTIVSITSGYNDTGPKPENFTTPARPFVIHMDGFETRKWAHRTELARAQERVDVIIPSINDPIDLDLKQLIDTSDNNFRSPFEIPKARVMELLSSKDAGNFSISPYLRFFATKDLTIIRACPVAISVPETEPNKSPKCFLIDINDASPKTPQIL